MLFGSDVAGKFLLLLFANPYFQIAMLLGRWIPVDKYMCSENVASCQMFWIWGWQGEEDFAGGWVNFVFFLFIKPVLCFMLLQTCWCLLDGLHVDGVLGRFNRIFSSTFRMSLPHVFQMQSGGVLPLVPHTYISPGFSLRGEAHINKE